MTTREPVGQLFLRPREIAIILGLSKSKIYTLIESGELPSRRMGKSIRVHRDDLDKWVDQLSSIPQPE